MNTANPNVTQRKVAFIVEGVGFLEIFSIPILSALLKEKGHLVRLFLVYSNMGKTVKKLKDWQPDILAYSICSYEADKYLEINKRLKAETNSFSVFGGAHPTFFPAHLKAEGVDAICKGEADITFPQMVGLFGSEAMYHVENFSFKLADNQIKENPLAPLVQDLDALPFPDRSLIYSQSPFLKLNPVKQFFAGRGCPYKCTYCSNHIFNNMYKGKGKIIRTKSVDYLLAEIKDVQKKYPLTFIKFHDDIFGLDFEWLEEFSNKYKKEIGLPFFCYARPNMINDEYCRLLRKAGCYSICMAIESGNEEIRKKILRRDVSDAVIVTAGDIIEKHELCLYTLNMVGLPGESEQNMIETILLNQLTRSDYADASIFQPYPGTELAEHAKSEGYISGDFKSVRSQYSETILNFPKDHKNIIFVLHRLFAFFVDHPTALSKRKLIYLIGNKVKFFLNLLNRLYYGYYLHKRIYGSAIPFSVRLRGALSIMFSQGRT